MIRNGKKKAISCALVAAMSVGLAACGTTSYDFKVSYDGIKQGMFHRKYRFMIRQYLRRMVNTISLVPICLQQKAVTC